MEIKVGARLHNRRLTKKERKALKRKRTKDAGVVSIPSSSQPRKRGEPKRKKTKLKKTKGEKSSRPDDELEKSSPASDPVSNFSPTALSILEKIREKDGNHGSLSDWLNPGHPLYDEALKSLWKHKLTKRERKEIVARDKAMIEAQVVSIQHAFTPLADDHCESPFEAYRDIKGVLDALCVRLGKTPKTLRIYDPYFCAGTVKRHLGQLGFEDVYNKNEDFYKVIREGKIPPHDVVVTNPPYSNNHVERLLDFVKGNGGKPFLLLMPNYFCAKPYYCRDIVHFYMYPRKRYCYWTPKGLRGGDKVQKNHVGAGGYRTSPFISFWYVGEGSRALNLLKDIGDGKDVGVCKTLEKLPDWVKPKEL